MTDPLDPVVISIERFAPEVKDQPRVDMTDWRIVRLPIQGRKEFDPDGRLVLAGYPVGKSSLRITSPFPPKGFIDFSARTVVSGSGRVYLLTTPPFDPEADVDEWGNFRVQLAISGLRTNSESDVTEAVWTAMLQAAH